MARQGGHQIVAAVAADDDVVRFPGEEERVALDLYDAGWQLCYVPDVVAHHHPSPRRASDERRQIDLARSQLLTATMRLPWSHVAREMGAALRSPVGRRGLIGAFPRVPRALRSRRRLSPRTLHARALLRTDPVRIDPGRIDPGRIDPVQPDRGGERDA